ncbi:MAG: type II toxin-antitoxin system RelE/ParE family toxin [Rhodanobacter sp.]
MPADIRDQLKAKLAQRLETARVPAARLHGMPDCYKIKLRTVGYRLVYQVQDERVVVVVIAVGRRDKGLVYLSAKKRV